VTIAKKRAAFWFLLSVLWLGLIGFASLNPAPPGLKVLERVTSWFPFPGPAMRTAQAVIHAFVFGIWAVLCGKALASVFPSTPPLRLLIFSMTAVLVVGGAIEIIQTWIPNRAPDVVDLSSDMVGAFVFLRVSQSNFIDRFLHHAPIASTSCLVVRHRSQRAEK